LGEAIKEYKNEGIVFKRQKLLTFNFNEGDCPHATIGGTAAAAPPPSGLATLPSVGAVPVTPY